MVQGKYLNQWNMTGLDINAWTSSYSCWTSTTSRPLVQQDNLYKVASGS